MTDTEHSPRRKPDARAAAAMLCALLAMAAMAKTRRETPQPDYDLARSGKAEAAATVERRLRPFLEARERGMAPSGQWPTDADLMMLARTWGNLSEPFKELYKRAISIPNGFVSHISPSGKFEVYYTTRGSDGVVTTDTYGYSSTNWRNRSVAANGVPDYVDEVAWALDSSWSMHVDRFGFKPPIGDTDSRHTSTRYKVLLRDMNGNYGYTYPSFTSGAGYASYIEIENDWAEDHYWGSPPTDYKDRPNDAVYITCAHELFHGVHYSMGHDISSYVDDFPLGWLEGTAVLMEELGFDYVNDYIQYSDDFFQDPHERMLDPYVNPYDLKVYKNSLLAMYLFAHAGPSPAIDFVKEVHVSSYRRRLAFHANILAACQAVGRSWPGLLGSFFTDSYFTGTRASGGRFLPDAALLGEWTVYTDIPDSNDGKTKTVSPYGMESFCYRPNLGHADTQYVTFLCPAASAAGELDVQVILEPKAGASTVVPMALEGGLYGTVRVNGWKDYRQLVTIVSNGSWLTSRAVTVFFSASPPDSVPALPCDTCDSSDEFPPQLLAIYPNPVRLGKHARLSFECADLVEVTLYTPEGLRVFQTAVDPSAFSDKRSKRRLDWYFRNNSGRKVLPGTYIAVVGREDPETRGMRLSERKILVRP